MAELWYRLRQLPDLTLNKYASLEENGVDGVLENHSAFLRQLNRKGLIAGLSFHLFYLYYVPEDAAKDTPGNRLQIYLMVRGKSENMDNVPALIEASPLSEFFDLQAKMSKKEGGLPNTMQNVFEKNGEKLPVFNTCAFLTKTETFLPARSGEGDDYYMIREWEMNEDGRLYNMCKMMEALGRTALYRVDLYPVERSIALREALRKPMSILRKRQEERGSGKDYDGKDVLDNYEDMIEKYDSSPHFILNAMVFANGRDDATSILDAAGAESLTKGKYNIACFNTNLTPTSFLEGEEVSLDNIRDKMAVRRGRTGLIISREDTIGINLNYLPTLFSLEEAAPFFRLPALYDGEVIQIPKETAPEAVNKEGSLFLGKDKNGYDVYFPLKLLPKHAFISGVPGSGKTNTMHHITSSLWKDHRIPFLVLEPAKQEYRALANDPDMKELYLFSPNADMSFPLHINPFEMPKGTLVAEHIRRLCSVFEGAFPFEPPAPFILDTSIEAVYRRLGWRPDHKYTGEEKNDDGTKKALPTLSMLYEQFEKEMQKTSYGEETKGSLMSILQVRIGSLMRREMGDVFDVPQSTFPPEKWLEVPAVIELESMGTGPANFLTLLLCSLIRETLKANPNFSGNLRHVIFLEEAHNLIGPESEEKTGAEADPKTAATAFIVKMLAEVRALKEGIVIADQLPTVMAQEVLKNTGLKLGLRITSADDRQLLGSTMAASGLQLEQMATFQVGEALIFYEGLKRPFGMRISEWWGHLQDKALKEEMVTPKNDADLRRALSGSATYQDENILSIDIICKKYYQKFNSLNYDFDTANKDLDYIKKLNVRIKKLRELIGDIATGKVSLTPELVEKHNDDLFMLEGLVEDINGSQSKAGNIVDIIGSCFEWIDDLERLKNDRWQRFSVSDNVYLKIEILQFSIADKTLKLYRKAVSSYQEFSSKVDQSMIQKIEDVFNETKEDMKAYEKKQDLNSFIS